MDAVIITNGSPNEIAALVLAVQGQPSETPVDAVAGQFAAGLRARLSSLSAPDVCIPKTAAICAARHYIASHESGCCNQPVDFGAICQDCSELKDCGGWLNASAPLFDAAGLHPKLQRPREEFE